MGQFAAGLMGFSAGFVVAGGVATMMVGLGIISRFIGISGTANRIRAYENAILAGAAAGTVLTTFSVSIPVGSWILAAAGLFTGIFVGGWIMALAEIANIFPVLCRRFRITRGMTLMVISLAAGKTAGSLIDFYMRWGTG